MGEPVLKPLIALLGDQNSYMRQVAVLTLRELGNPQAIQPLSEFLQREKDHLLKLGAMQALLRIKDEQIISVLVEVSKQEKDPWTQEDLVMLLSRLQDRRIIPILIEVLQKADSLHRNRMTNEIHQFGTREALIALQEYEAGADR